MAVQEGADYKKEIEAAMFVSNKAMSVQEIGESLGIKSFSSVKSIISALIEDYKARDSALEIIEINGKYLLTVRKEYLAKVNRLAGTPDISKPGLRILAYISKNEPVMQSRLVKIFGTSAYIYIKELLESEFISSTRFKTTKSIKTAPKFAEYFSLNK